MRAKFLPPLRRLPTVRGICANVQIWWLSGELAQKGRLLGFGHHSASEGGGIYIHQGLFPWFEVPFLMIVCYLSSIVKYLDIIMSPRAGWRFEGWKLRLKFEGWKVGEFKVRPSLLFKCSLIAYVLVHAFKTTASCLSVQLEWVEKLQSWPIDWASQSAIIIRLWLIKWAKCRVGRKQPSNSRS